jgi:hypothetical protein
MMVWNTIPKFSAVTAFFATTVKVEDWVKKDQVILIAKITGVFAFLAGLVSAVALAVIGDPRFFGIAAIGIPMGIINYLYLRDYSVVLGELQDRKTVEKSAAKVEQEGDEIKEGISKLEAHIQELKSYRAKLEEQVAQMTATHQTFSEKLAFLQLQTDTFSQLATKMEVSSKAAFAVGEKIESDAKKIAERMESFSAQETRENPEILAKLAELKIRQEKIAKIYERMHILRAIKIEAINYSRQDLEGYQQLLQKVPSIEKLFRLEFA